MKQSTHKAKARKTPRGVIRFPGITADAVTLGVERSHLYRVLAGERESKSLTARYRALKKGGKR